MTPGVDKTFFSRNLRSVTLVSAALPEVPSASESAKKSLQGALAIQFGYNLEKYRVSLTNFSNKAGANRLTNSLLLADWFLAPGFYAGLGITNAKLKKGKIIN